MYTYLHLVLQKRTDWIHKNCVVLLVFFFWNFSHYRTQLIRLLFSLPTLARVASKYSIISNWNEFVEYDVVLYCFAVCYLFVYWELFGFWELTVDYVCCLLFFFSSLSHSIHSWCVNLFFVSVYCWLFRNFFCVFFFSFLGSLVITVRVVCSFGLLKYFC